MHQQKVIVAIRVRPLLQFQTQSCVFVPQFSSQIHLHHPLNSQRVYVFNYDHVFDMNSEQDQIYQNSVFNLVQKVLEGYNSTVFSYGQTGSGKTFTIQGGSNNGIMGRSGRHILLAAHSKCQQQFLIRCSYIQIYNQQIRDLLTKDKKIIKLTEKPKQGFVPENLNSITVVSEEDIHKVMAYGFSKRITGQTKLNQFSSRSHSIFTIYIESFNQYHKLITGKLHLVDLAGSQRIKKSKSQGIRLKEAIKINQSLSALGNVISALIDKTVKFIPYRDSKLTKILNDSLGGNSKTLMIGIISPDISNYEQTLSTLRYASRVKLIKNKPRININPEDSLLLEYEREIARLKNMIQQLKQKEMNQNNKESQIVINYKINQIQHQIIKNSQQNQNKQEKIILQYQCYKLKVNQLIEKKKKLLKIKQNKQVILFYQEQLNLMQRNYQSLQSEVTQMRELLLNLKLKYKSVLNQIQDLQNQKKQEKKQLLRIINQQNKQIQIYYNIAQNINNEKNHNKIQNRYKRNNRIIRINSLQKSKFKNLLKQAYIKIN